ACCAIASAASIALTPASQEWGWLFAAQIAAARICMSGLVTVRTSIWKANYPQSHRARIAGRLQALNALLLLGMGTVVSLLFTFDASFYRVVYPALAVFGALSLIPLRKLRVRGEERALEQYRAAHAGGAGDPPLRALLRGLREARDILRRDRPFARYCTAQYLLGSSNFMVDPVLTYWLAQKPGLGYFTPLLLMELIPAILVPLSIPHWAAHFDRVGVLRFRVVNSMLWLISALFAAAALLVDRAPLSGNVALPLGGWQVGLFPLATVLALAVLAGGRIANGAARGGGAIAWSLGHLQFAGPHDAELYLGIHVGLTGLRGLIMPSIGTWLFGLLGPGELLVAGCLTTGALLSFRRLALEQERAGPHVAVPCEGERPETEAAPLVANDQAPMTQ
ncbi:MAG: hypothetical protein AB1716_15360, partial [Planctomycetota bacterium]